MSFEEKRVKYSLIAFAIVFFVSYELSSRNYTDMLAYSVISSVFLMAWYLISPVFAYPSSLIFQFMLPTDLPIVTMSLTTILGLICLGLLAYGESDRKTSNFTTTEYLGFLFLAMLFILSILHGLPISFRNYRFMHFLEAVLVLFCIGRMITTEKKLKIFSWVLVLTVVAMTVRHYSFVHGFELSFFGFENNHVSRQLSYLFFFVIGMFWAEKNKLMKTAILITIAFTGQVLIQLGSRATYLTLAMVAVIFGIRYIGRKAAWALGIGALILFLYYSPAEFYDEFKSIFEDVPKGLDSEDPSVVGRTFAMQEGIELVKRRPLHGWGPGHFEEAMGRHSGVFMNAHNSYLELAVGWGIPGLIVYIMLFITSILNLKIVRKITKNKNQFLYEMAGGCLFGSVALFINQFFINAPWDPIVWISFGLSVALLYCVKSSSEFDDVQQIIDNVPVEQPHKEEIN